MSSAWGTSKLRIGEKPYVEYAKLTNILKRVILWLLRGWFDEQAEVSVVFELSQSLSLVQKLEANDFCEKVWGLLHISW